MKKPLISIVSVLLCLCFVACVPYFPDVPDAKDNKDELIAYYSDDQNYVALEGKVIAVNERFRIITVDVLTENYDTKYGFDKMYETGFTNFYLVTDEELVFGDQILFVTAPRPCLSDDVYPIVAMERNGENILPFAEGKVLYLEELKNK